MTTVLERCLMDADGTLPPANELISALNDKTVLDNVTKAIKFDDAGKPLMRRSEFGCEFKLVTDAQKDNPGDIVGEGWLSKTGWNLNDENVLSTAFKWRGAFANFNGRFLAVHDQQRWPIGMIVGKPRVVPEEGLYADRIVIFAEAADANGGLLRRGVEEGVLNGISIGYIVHDDEWEKDEDDNYTGRVFFKKASLFEASLVNIGANQRALFEKTNSFYVTNGLESSETSESKQAVLNRLQKTETKTETEMEPEPKTDTVNIGSGKMAKDLSLDALNERFDDFEAKRIDETQFKADFESLKKDYSTIISWKDEVKDNLITKDQLGLRLDKIMENIVRVEDNVKTAQAAINARNELDDKFVYDDWKSMLKNHPYIRDDSGHVMSDVHQKAYLLFNGPVSYDNMKDGQRLRNLRTLHDCCYCIDAWYHYTHKNRHRMEKLPIFDQLREQVRLFDEDIYQAMSMDAMAAGSTGYGAEWIPTAFSAQFMEYFRATPSLSSRFPLWVIPEGSSGTYPFQEGVAVVYSGSEATTYNPAEARKTQFATSSKTFTPAVFIAALPASAELTEDAIVDMVSVIRTELAKAMSESLDSVIINGDTTATHCDNAGTTAKYSTGAPEYLFNGVREIALTTAACNVDLEAMTGTATGPGSVTLDRLIGIQEMSGGYGLHPESCIWLTSIKGRAQILMALDTAALYGTLQYLTSGKLADILGSEVVVSEKYPQDLLATGVYDSNTDTKHTAISYLYTPALMLAQKRGITLEFDKNIYTQQLAFVATGRWDFGQICSSAHYPSVYAYNVAHTA